MQLIAFRSIAHNNGKIFVGDIGKNRVFVLDDTMDVETVGETGNGRLQFKASFWSNKSPVSVLLLLPVNYRGLVVLSQTPRVLFWWLTPTTIVCNCSTLITLLRPWLR